MYISQKLITFSFFYLISLKDIDYDFFLLQVILHDIDGMVIRTL